MAIDDRGDAILDRPDRSACSPETPLARRSTSR
jgi:hypothetical protein